jgi:alkylation response protein AidB-like acyl-CoA dehydrogenase
MDVRLSPEQRALRDSAAQVVDRLGPQAVGQLDDRERLAKLDAAVAASGWRELRTATGDGAPLASGVEVGLVAEELGRGLADMPFLGPTLAAELRRLAAALPAPADVRETVAFTPDLGALASAVDGAVAGPALPASARPDLALPAGSVADSTLPSPGAVAIDALGAVCALVLVPAGDGNDDSAGYTLGEVALDPDVAPDRSGSDLTRPVVALDPAATVTPIAGQAQPITSGALTGLTALGLAVTCADLVGTMRGAVDLASGYAKERRQYGVAIGSFQAVQHLLADALVATEGAASVALHAAWAADALPPAEAVAAAALAKAWCARAARIVCETAIQVHGGIGNTWECLAHVHLRRALLSSDLFGGTGPSLARVLAHHGIGARDAVR